MNHKIGVFFLAILIAMQAPIEEAYGIQYSVSGGNARGGGSVSMNIKAANSATVNSGMSINGASLKPTTRSIGATLIFEESHSVKDSTGKSASVYVKVANAPNGLTYSSQVLPGEGLVAAQPSVSAEQWLTVPKADFISTKATSSYGTLSADVGLEMAKSSSTGDYVTLNGYDGKASASASSVSATQIAASGTAYSSRIYGDAKDGSGSYSINTPLKGISGGKATFNSLNDQSSAGTSTQVYQGGHVNGGFTSKLIAGTKTQTRSSNYGTDYDLRLVAYKAATVPTVSGILGYYVNPTTSANKIQGAATVAQAGDRIYVAAGTYKENIKIDKSLSVIGFGGIAKTIVDGQLKGAVFTIGQNKANIDVSLSGMTIKNGKSTYGAGIQDYGRLTITDCAISGNTATFGGGIYANQGTVTLNRDTITGNKATDRGGGVQIEDGTFIMNGGTITGNTATNYGGGIFTSYSPVTLNSGSSISRNVAGEGGAIYSHYGTVNLKSGSSIVGNQANNGGGIKTNSGTITMNGGAITGNTATYYGGAIYNDAATLILNSGTITTNMAEDGGGVCNDFYSTIVMNGGFIANNKAKNRGGGIYSDQSNTMTINGGTITGNTATSGGGIFSDLGSTLTLKTGSSITNNIAIQGAGIYTYLGTVNLNGGSITGNTATSNGGGIFNNGGTINLNSGAITTNTAKALSLSAGGIKNRGTINGDKGLVIGNAPDNIKS